MTVEHVKPTKEDRIYTINELWKRYRATKKSQDWSVERDILEDMRQEIGYLLELYNQDPPDERYVEFDAEGKPKKGAE